MKPHIVEQYFYDDEEVANKVKGLIGTRLQEPEVINKISIHIEPVFDSDGKCKFRTLTDVWFKK